MPLVLLASYPKSGNTWVRALLSNYLSEDQEPVSINNLRNKNLLQRHNFDERLGLSSAIMTDEEILRHRFRYQQLKAMEAQSMNFAKTHEPCLHLPDGMPLFSSLSFSSVIYIVRNPLDVAVSYAHHLQCSIDQSIKIMGNHQAMLSNQRLGINPGLPHKVSDWSHNVSSWLDQRELPIKVVSYEYLHANTNAALAEIIDFCGLTQDSARRARSVENSCFSQLREQEKCDKFEERYPLTPNFFRKGQIGDWRSTLTDKQIKSVVGQHGPVMERLGYRQEAERFMLKRENDYQLNLT